MIEEILRTGVLFSPWPIRLEDGSIIEGQLGINQICKTKCLNQTCSQMRSSIIGTRCPLGLTVYEARVDDQVLQVFGVVGPQHRDSLPTHIDFKRACKGRTVTASDFSTWISRIKQLSSIIKQNNDHSLAEALEPLHDAMRLARDVEQLSNRLLEEIYPIEAEKFDVATATQKALVKSASLLVDTFDLLEVYLNPLAATFGQPRSIEIYKLLDKLAKIAVIARRNEHRPVVRISGNTRRSFDLYESFKLIPLTLIDNAQKYSRQGGQVWIEVGEFGSALEVSIISEGALLSDIEKINIFNRGYRGEAARKIYPSGMGLGLYIAQLVAQAHGSSIRVFSTALGYEIAGIPQAKNVFSFQVRDLPPKIKTKLD